MQTEKKQNLLIQSLLVLGTLGRLIPHPWNATPMGAVSLVGGAKLKGMWRWITPFLCLVASDIVLQTFLYPTLNRDWLLGLPFIYAAFAVNIWMGRFASGENRFAKVGGLSFVAATQFFILTNFGTWLTTPFYAKTVEGLVQCYILAIPFFGPMILGNLAWSLGIYWAIEKSEQWAGAWKAETASA